MRIYIQKYSTDNMIIYKETTLQSVISDLTTILVLLVLFAADVLFSIYIARSFVIDVMVCFVFITFLSNYNTGPKKEVTREELAEMLS